MLQVGSFEALVVRKPIKNLHLSVLPPNGKIRVTSPLQMKDDAIRMLIATRIPWIRKQMAKFEAQGRQSQREYVSGESHYFFGKHYRLEVVHKDEPPRVWIKGKNRIVLQVRTINIDSKKEEVMTDWYRSELKKEAEKLISKWEKKIGVKAKSWGIKRMKTRWGTCNQKTGRILLNLELAKKPIACVGYVIVHELIHLIERKHSERFVGLMAKHLPKWRSLKEELNQFMLSHEKWNH